MADITQAVPLTEASSTKQAPSAKSPKQRFGPLQPQAHAGPTQQGTDLRHLTLAAHLWREWQGLIEV
jgi:hypothetical protein